MCTEAPAILPLCKLVMFLARRPKADLTVSSTFCTNRVDDCIRNRGGGTTRLASVVDALVEVRPHPGELGELDLPRACLGQKPPFWDVKHHARSYKNTTKNSFTIENAKVKLNRPERARTVRVELAKHLHHALATTGES